MEGEYEDAPWSHKNFFDHELEEFPADVHTRLPPSRILVYYKKALKAILSWMGQADNQVGRTLKN